MFNKLMSLAMVFFALLGCSKDKTDYEAELAEVVKDDILFKEVFKVTKEDYIISAEALTGNFYKGYNEVRLKVTDAKGVFVQATSLTLLPSLFSSNGDRSYAPYSENLVFDTKDNYYKGYVILTQESTASNTWSFRFNIKLNENTFELNQDIQVKNQENKNLNMISFLANDGQEYSIALVSPFKPNVAENPLVAAIYKFEKASSGNLSYYSRVDDFTLRLDPRMPEPSMGNHSSPNNKDLKQESDGLYHGVVNYTMTGNWTLNFILENQDGKIIKGTVVPTDFTPGVQGLKSELFIDVLF